jgi:hypothetical protein
MYLLHWHTLHHTTAAAAAGGGSSSNNNNGGNGSSNSGDSRARSDTPGLQLSVSALNLLQSASSALDLLGMGQPSPTMHCVDDDAALEDIVLNEVSHSSQSLSLSL